MWGRAPSEVHGQSLYQGVRGQSPLKLKTLWQLDARIKPQICSLLGYIFKAFCNLQKHEGLFIIIVMCLSQTKNVATRQLISMLHGGNTGFSGTNLTCNH